MHRLTEPIILATHGTECLKYVSKTENSSLVASVLDVLSFAVENHTYHVKNYILSKEIFQKVMSKYNDNCVLFYFVFYYNFVGLTPNFS